MDSFSTPALEVANNHAYASDELSSNQNNIWTVSGPFGTQKTRGACRDACRLAARGHKALIVQPTVLLINQTLETTRKFKEAGGGEFPIRSIYSEGRQPCVRDIIRHISETGRGGEVLLISRESFLRICGMDVARRREWHVYMDEAPQIDWSREYRFGSHRDEILNLLHDEYHNAEYQELVCADDQLCDDIKRNETRDEIWEILGDFASRLDSRHWQVLVSGDCLEAFRNGESDSLTLSAIMLPSLFDGWKSFTLLGADLEETLCCKWFINKGIAFHPHPRIKISQKKHRNGRHLMIYYAHDADYSKQIRQTEIDLVGGERITIEELNVQKVIKLFGGQPCVYLANKDSAIQIPDGVQLPNSPHGLNTYMGVHNVAVFSALNPPPSHISNRGRLPGSQAVAAWRTRSGNCGMVMAPGMWRRSPR
jgi:hypothetical protein